LQRYSQASASCCLDLSIARVAIHLRQWQRDFGAFERDGSILAMDWLVVP
jgi:hypothetical protein